DAAVRQAGEARTFELADAIEAGKDPFDAKFWTPYNEMDRDISELHVHVGTTLGSSVGTLDRLYRATLPAVITVIAGALWLMWRASRRVALQIVAPVLTLRNAAANLVTDESSPAIALDSAVT